MTMKSFIIQLVVSAYNDQTSKKMVVDDFDVKGIKKNQNSDAGFEVFTKRADDWLRLRIYATFSATNEVGPFRVEEQETISQIGSGDEVFVADAYLDREFFYGDNNYIRRLIDIADDDVGNALLLESGDALLLEDGTPLQLEA